MSDGPDEDAKTMRALGAICGITVMVVTLGFSACERKTKTLLTETRIACIEAGGSWVSAAGGSSGGQCLMLAQPQSPEAGTTRPKPNPRYEQP